MPSGLPPGRQAPPWTLADRAVFDGGYCAWGFALFGNFTKEPSFFVGAVLLFMKIAEIFSSGFFDFSYFISCLKWALSDILYIMKILTP